MPLTMVNRSAEIIVVGQVNILLTFVLHVTWFDFFLLLFFVFYFSIFSFVVIAAV